MTKLTDVLEYIDSCSDKQWLKFCEWMEYRGYIIEGKYLHDYDYPHVTHCKDCALNGTDDCSMHFEDDEKVYQWNRENDFCSFAVRKEE